MSWDGFAQTEWALVNGELHHVSDFAHLSVNERPEAICEECRNPLIFKCGDEKAHHFAHRNGDECTGKGEGIEHYNAKLYLTDTLKKTNSIVALNRCRWCSGLSGDKITVEYDDV